MKENSPEDIKKFVDGLFTDLFKQELTDEFTANGFIKVGDKWINARYMERMLDKDYG